MFADIPSSANCEPEMQTVNLSHLVNNNELEQQQDKTTRESQSIWKNDDLNRKSMIRLDNQHSISQLNLYFPHCIRLPKCGGCCPSERLQCIARTFTLQNITVVFRRTI